MYKNIPPLTEVKYKGDIILFIFYFNAYSAGNRLILTNTFNAGTNDTVRSQIKSVAGIRTRFKTYKPFSFWRILYDVTVLFIGLHFDLIHKTWIYDFSYAVKSAETCIKDSRLYRFSIFKLPIFRSRVRAVKNGVGLIRPNHFRSKL